MRQAQATFDAEFGVGEGVGHRISLPILSFPRSGAHRYTQVQPNRKIRHFGRDAEIQAMDGNQSVVQALGSSDLPKLGFPSVDTRASVVSHSLPSLDAGFRHP